MSKAVKGATAAWRRVKAAVLLPWYRRTGRPIPDVTAFQRRIPFWARRAYSQNGEDGILESIFAVIGTTNRYVVEFGVENGRECNSRHLIERRGWTGLRMDGAEPPPGSDIRQAFVTAENVEDLFARFDVPEQFDLLCIDINGNDYWVWKAIRRYRPRVVVIEYNASLPPLPAVTIPYDAAFHWDETTYFGSSLGALAQLGTQKGYALIATDRNGVNAFFVASDLTRHFVTRPIEQLWHAPAFISGSGSVGHPPDPLARNFVSV